jgi:hypothetical protein
MNGQGVFERAQGFPEHFVVHIRHGQHLIVRSQLMAGFHLFLNHRPIFPNVGLDLLDSFVPAGLGGIIARLKLEDAFGQQGIFVPRTGPGKQGREQNHSHETPVHTRHPLGWYRL